MVLDLISISLNWLFHTRCSSCPPDLQGCLEAQGQLRNSAGQSRNASVIKMSLVTEQSPMKPGEIRAPRGIACDNRRPERGLETASSPLCMCKMQLRSGGHLWLDMPETPVRTCSGNFLADEGISLSNSAVLFNKPLCTNGKRLVDTWVIALPLL